MTTSTQAFGRTDPTTNKPVRLNRLIDLLASGQGAVGTFVPNGDEERLFALADSPYDFVVIEMETGGFDFPTLRASLRCLLDRGAILRGGTLQPKPTPLVRVPFNGKEVAQWIVKQALNEGAYGLMLPQMNNAGDLDKAVRAARYPQLRDAEDIEPRGERGWPAQRAARYWGLPIADYTRVADVWPLDAQGELVLMPLIEEEEAVHNIRELVRVPGVTAFFIGEGDLSTSLGYPANPDAPAVQEAVREVLAVCKEAGVPAASIPRPGKIEQRVQDGCTILFVAPGLSFSAAEQGLKALGR